MLEMLCEGRHRKERDPEPRQVNANCEKYKLNAGL